MSSRSHSYYRISIQNLADLDQSSYKKEPVIYTNSSTKVDLFQNESKMLDKKYKKQYSQFRQSFCKRSKSQIQKLQRIIKDTNDLNQILADPYKWQLKNNRKQSYQIQAINNFQQNKYVQATAKPRWRQNRRMDI